MDRRIGCLIVNIGTPNSADVNDVAAYLKEFLMDKEVVNIPYPLRWMLVHGIVATRRAPLSAVKYRSIWTNAGSPLLVASKDYAGKLQQVIPEIQVALGMRYGNPSIESACEELVQGGCEEIIVFPHYPQFARATTVSSQLEVDRVLKKLGFKGRVKQIQPYYQEMDFVQLWVSKLQPVRSQFEHFLFTFHGLPLSQLKGRIKDCQGDACCLRPEACATGCYRAQCLKTAHKIAEELGLAKTEYSFSFQSRLGPVEWIKPYTDHVLLDLAHKGTKKLCVVAPSFVTDCLETLEEVAIEGKHTFLNGGGEEFTYISCLNADEDWISVSKKMLLKEVQNG